MSNKARRSATTSLDEFLAHIVHKDAGIGYAVHHHSNGRHVGMFKVRAFAPQDVLQPMHPRRPADRQCVGREGSFSGIRCPRACRSSGTPASKRC